MEYVLARRCDEFSKWVTHSRALITVWTGWSLYSAAVKDDNGCSVIFTGLVL